MKKNNKNKKKIDTKTILYYGCIVAVTLFAIIISININEISMTPEQLLKQNINVSLFNLKIIGNIILFISYITLVIYPVRQLFNKVIVAKIPPKGDKGPRGLRGKTGKNGGCSTCGDGLCYMKIMAHITDTINCWRAINKYDELPKNYIIKNNYIKYKVKRQCKSKEFNDILTKFGSNSKTCTDVFTTSYIGQDGKCGIYDYMFNMWTRWILLILIYENGFMFLDSENYTENDFDSLIIDEDKQPNTDDPLIKLLESTTTKFKNNKKFNDIIKPIITEYLYNKFNNNKFNTNIVLKDGPFEEIKKYEAWYWGSDEYSKPNIIIKQPPTSAENIIKFDFKETNNYYRLWSSDYALQTKANNGIRIPFKPLINIVGEEGLPITILRPYHYINEKETNPNFRTYKPLGDVIFHSKDINTENFINRCFPDNIKHNKKILKALTPKGEKNNTVLVAGSSESVQPPSHYKLLYTTTRTDGVNSNISALNIWQPIPSDTDDFIAMGCVIDTKPLNVTEEETITALKSDVKDPIHKKYQPSTDLVYCIKKTYVTTTTVVKRQPFYKSNEDLNYVDNPLIFYKSINYNLFNQSEEIQPKYKINKKDPPTPNYSPSVDPDIPKYVTSKKPDKYSIMSIFK